MRRTRHTHDPDAHVAKTSHQAQSQRQRELTSSNRVRNAPHQQGTIAELAEKLGVSKSEVRRLKREGRLELELNRLSSTT